MVETFLLIVGLVLIFSLMGVRIVVVTGFNLTLLDFSFLSSTIRTSRKKFSSWGAFECLEEMSWLDLLCWVSVKILLEIAVSIAKE